MSVDAGARKFARERVSDLIYEDLRDRILSGALPHGARLPAERDLAAEYGVSGQTVRESIRALTAMGLVSSKQGRGAFVTARSDSLTAFSLASVIQLDKLGVADVLGVLGALLTHATALGVTRASDEDLAQLRESAENMLVPSPEKSAENLSVFLRRLAAVGHNPLLTVLCGFLIDVQVRLALELGTKRPTAWKKAAGALQDDRMALVAALEARDAERAVMCLETYSDRMRELIDTASQSKRFRLTDTDFARLVSQLSADQKKLLD
ncbi:FadR/GntR family transcriptional regulator [Streptomyces sp. NPDC056716]|uniref:FadR/GntR family transcriptional regulator n=1 Tax=unclassified Streptomyces TaxID=2593676 RepID=UPI0036A8177D